MNAAPCSCRVGMNAMRDPARESRMSMISSPGRPKTWRTSSFERHWTSRSEAFTAIGSVLLLLMMLPIPRWRLRSRPAAGLRVGEGRAHRELLDVHELRERDRIQIGPELRVDRHHDRAAPVGARGHELRVTGDVAGVAEHLAAR